MPLERSRREPKEERSNGAKRLVSALQSILVVGNVLKKWRRWIAEVRDVNM